MNRYWLRPILAGLAAAAIAWHGALLAAPYVLMAVAMKRIGTQSSVNSFYFAQMSTADNQPVVRPSPDLAYASCIFDVSDGPVRIDVPSVPGSYWSLSIFDARTDVAKVVSVRDNGNNPARLLLQKQGAKPKIVSGYEAVPLKYGKGIALIRILLTDPAQYAEIDAIRRQARCRRA